MSASQMTPVHAAHIQLHRHDLPRGLTLGAVVAIDTETMGLNPQRDRLCLVQLSAGDGTPRSCQFALGGQATMRPT